MKPVDQMDTRLGFGDCFRACVASIFEFPIEEMPNFWDHTQDARVFWKMVNDWMRERLGMGCFPVKLTEEHEYMLKDVMCVALGKQRRSDEDHAVVWRNELIHDPHPSRDGIINHPDTYALFISIDPAPLRAITSMEMQQES